MSSAAFRKREYERAAKIFNAARELLIEDRPGYLERACRGEPDLQARVESMLAQDVGDERLRELLQRGDEPPDWIGPYRVRNKIGEGGMGVVYRAEQRVPVRRTVALKILKRGMDSRKFISRFDSERQALALMNHSHVARVLDPGLTDDGRPYFAMEYVPGIPITKHCRDNRLSVRDRLKLFIQVCEGVDHAHQRGIIHRDLKPSNVLVVSGDGPFVKIIDFGVAKAMHRPLIEDEACTSHGELLGTLEYMSPEQAGGEGLEIDQRSDVYSLGVLLYEVLVEDLPFGRETLRNQPFHEVLRVVREVDPPKPSARVRREGKGNRPSPRILRGELDWITMRAMEKDRNRRYRSAAEISDEIRRYLVHEPVMAGPAKMRYRLTKFVRKRRWAMVSVFVYVATVVFFLWLLRLHGADPSQMGLDQALSPSP